MPRCPTDAGPGDHAMRKVVLVAILLAVAGCETIKGAGRDIQSGGRAIERTMTRITN